MNYRHVVSFTFDIFYNTDKMAKSETKLLKFTNQTFKSKAKKREPKKANMVIPS